MRKLLQCPIKNKDIMKYSRKCVLTKNITGSSSITAPATLFLSYNEFYEFFLCFVLVSFIALLLQ